MNAQPPISATTDTKGISGALANLPAPNFPIVISEWQRNSREVVRVALDRFNGRITIDVRSWWRDGDGEWKPGRGGLTLAVKHLPALANGFANALSRAQALGLVECKQEV